MTVDLLDGFFEKHSNVKFQENPSSGSQPEGQTDMTKLIVTFVFMRMCLKEQSVNKGILCLAEIQQIPLEGRKNYRHQSAKDLHVLSGGHVV
jgi:hypothetical protein